MSEAAAAYYRDGYVHLRGFIPPEVGRGFLARMQADPSRFVRIDADQPPEAVWQEVAAGMRGRGLLP